MITFESKGDFKRLNGFFERALNIVHLGVLDKYGEKGVKALEEASPKNTGRMSRSWYYEISHSNGCSKITWCNSDIEGGLNVALLVQYGHGTKKGSYVEGIDYINPAMKPIFDEMAIDAWREVTEEK